MTHELESIRALCDNMTFLSQGKVIFDGALKAAEFEGPREVRDFLARKPAAEARTGRQVVFNLEEG